MDMNQYLHTEYRFVTPSSQRAGERQFDGPAAGDWMRATKPVAEPTPRDRESMLFSLVLGTMLLMGCWGVLNMPDATTAEAPQAAVGVRPA